MRSIMRTIAFFCFLLVTHWSVGQESLIEGLTVETYYISDTNDATDTDGGFLEPGSVTYRIFLDMAEGVRFKRLFGLGQDTLRIMSTEVFFNNLDRGELIGAEIGANRLDENTVALDSWLTIGLASGDHLGVLKTEDSDGSIVGGTQNDGGSEGLPEGLLNNDAAAAGIPLTDADGLSLINDVTPSVSIWGANAAQDLNAVFGTENLSNSYKSNDIYLLPNQPLAGSGEENRILLGQFTTKGELSFTLNVELESPSGETIQMVSDSTDVERYSPFLIYPLPDLECGCTDPYYLEYNSEAFCSDEDLCQTLIVIGCTDTNACNYSSEANFNYPSLCCYSPDSCGADLDFYAICDPLSTVEFSQQEFMVFPNPVSESLTILSEQGMEGVELIEVLDLNGRIWIAQSLSRNREFRLNVMDLPSGVYVIRIQGDRLMSTLRFLKVH